jgi:hypothetical protein
MQIRLWRQGKKTVAVFDGESRVSRLTRINHDDNFWISNRPLPKADLKIDANRNGYPRLRWRMRGCYH